MIKLLNILKEIRVNNPLSVKFDDLQPRKKYRIKFIYDDGNTKSERTEDVLFLDYDEDENEKWLNVEILTNKEYWAEMGLEDIWFLLYPEDIIDIKNIDSSIKEIKINNPIKPFTFVPKYNKYGEFYYNDKLLGDNAVDNSDNYNCIGTIIPEKYIDTFQKYTIEKIQKDEDGDIIAFIDRKYVNIKDKFIKESKKKVIAAGILPIAQDTKKILVVKRAEGSPEPGTWCGVGGKVEESDKNLKETALREFKEEVGYKGKMRLKKVYTYKNDDLEFTNYIGLIPTEFTPKLDTSENTEYKWLTLFELKELPNKHYGLEELLDKWVKK